MRVCVKGVRRGLGVQERVLFWVREKERESEREVKRLLLRFVVGRRYRVFWRQCPWLMWHEEI